MALGFHFFFIFPDNSIIDARKLELLESRFVPLNPQKSVSQDVSNHSIGSDEQNRILEAHFIAEVSRDPLIRG